MSDHVIVIGAGFAGLSAAVALSDAGKRVTVLEAKNSAGGRARSFEEPISHELVDNGQHLLIAGYHHTFDFLKRLGTDQSVVLQPNLSVGFAEPGGAAYHLRCPGLPAPWHLFFGLFGLSSFGFADKLRMLHVIRDLRRESNSDETVAHWLERMHQSERTQKYFWEPLTIATLNEQPAVASVKGLKAVLKTMLMGSARDACLGLPAVGLSDLYTEQATQIIQAQGGDVLLNTSVDHLLVDAGQIQGVQLADGSVLNADAVITTVPPSVLQQWVEKAKLNLNADLAAFETAPIVSVNLWLDKPVTSSSFVGLVGTRFQWLFNKSSLLEAKPDAASYVAMIISAAHEEVDWTKQQLIDTALSELKACFPEAKEVQLQRAQVVRERHATVSLSVQAENARPLAQTQTRGLVLAGDWTQTGLPATIESAVLSGKTAARLVLEAI